MVTHAVEASTTVTTARAGLHTPVFAVELSSPATSIAPGSLRSLGAIHASPFAMPVEAASSPASAVVDGARAATASGETTPSPAPAVVDGAPSPLVCFICRSSSSSMVRAEADAPASAVVAAAHATA